VVNLSPLAPDSVLNGPATAKKTSLREHLVFQSDTDVNHFTCKLTFVCYSGDGVSVQHSIQE